MVFGGNGDPYVQQTIKSMKIANIPHDVLSGAEINRRFPKQMKIPDDYMCVIEEDAGILYAQKALRAMQVNKFYYLHHFLPPLCVHTAYNAIMYLYKVFASLSLYCCIYIVLDHDGFALYIASTFHLLRNSFRKWEGHCWIGTK